MLSKMPLFHAVAILDLCSSATMVSAVHGIHVSCDLPMSPRHLCVRPGHVGMFLQLHVPYCSSLNASRDDQYLCITAAQVSTAASQGLEEEDDAAVMSSPTRAACCTG